MSSTGSMDGNMPLGADRKDSRGSFSNFTTGETDGEAVWLTQESMLTELAILVGGLFCLSVMDVCR